ncbi:MAG: hypothetical protein NTW83_10600 [Cyanobacteria bacterium]|nr:hypothetical protein [Cyanobacteriota bacterium]
MLAALDETLTPIKAFMNGPQKTAYDKVLSFLSRHRDDLHGFPTEPVTALEHLEASSTPYQGTVVPDASAAVATLEALLKDQLKAARQEALNQLDSQEAKLKAAADFQQLDPAQQVEVLEATDRARREIEQGDGVSRIQMRVQRYASQEYAKQLERTAALAHPSNETNQRVTVVPASSLKIQCSLAQITNPAELKQWLEALRVAAQAELDQDHRISL